MTEKRSAPLSLTLAIFVGFILGILAGLIWGQNVLPVAEPMAQLFLRLLRMAVMPLIVTSIVSAVIHVGHLGRMSLKTMVYYIVSSMMAIFTGQILVNLFQPGLGADLPLTAQPAELASAEQTVGDIFLRMIPENPFESMAQGEVLPVIFFSVLFAVFVVKLEEKKKSIMRDWFDAAFEAMLNMTLFVVWTAPLGVFGIAARMVAGTGLESFSSLGGYFLVVLMGLAIHMGLNLPLLLLLVARVNPWAHYRGMGKALLFGFSTCSTMVTLPLTMKAVTEHSRVPRKIAGFTLPLGATVNMDGTALYECVAAIFIAQVYGIELSFAAQMMVALTALLASIGAASVPMSGMVMMSVILRAVGLPLEGVGLVLAVDRILDMFRTTANILSDSCGAVIVARLEGERLLGLGTGE